MAEKKNHKLNVWAFVLAASLTWGSTMFLLALAGTIGWGSKLIEVLSSLYIGYEAGWLGAIKGFLWGMFDLGVGALFFVLIYNYFADRK